MKNKLKNIFRNKEAILVCQAGQDSFRMIKFLPKAVEVVKIESVPIYSGAGGDELSGIVTALMQNTDYRGLPVVVCLPRYKTTFHLLKKVPAQSPQEIENITTLQAPRCLPYPQQDLISAYQLTSMDKEGYSDLNMVVTHRQTVEPYIEAFKAASPPSFFVAASSYGLLNYYHYHNPHDDAVNLLIDSDSAYPELAVVRGDKLLFSRSFRIERSVAGWQDDFLSEVNKSRAAYLREMPQAPVKIVILGAQNLSEDLAEILTKQVDLEVNVLAYGKIKFSAGVLDKIEKQPSSYAALIGLGLRKNEASLNLVPERIKGKNKQNIRKNEWLRLGLSVCAIAVILALGAVRNLNNKAVYLRRLKAQMNTLAVEARPLEEIERRLKLMDARLRKAPSGLEVLHEIYKIAPPAVSLFSLAFEEGGQITIRGQSPELGQVLSFVSELERSEVLRGYSAKVRYATKKIISSGEAVDFEIDCLREK
jgi:hypothetical protein